MGKIEIEVPQHLAHLNRWELERALERLISDTDIILNLVKGKDICARTREDRKEGKKTSALLQHLYLSSFFNELASYNQKELYRREGYELATEEDLITTLTSTPLLEGDREKVEEAIESVLEYESRIRNVQDGFLFTYYQFFSILFTELFFSMREKVREHFSEYLKKYARREELLLLTDEEVKEIEENPDVVKELLNVKPKRESMERFREEIARSGVLKAIRQVLNKEVMSFEEYTNAPISKLAYYLATGSGKTYIALVNYWQARRYLRGVSSFFLVVPNEDLALQHKRFFERFGVKTEFASTVNNKAMASEIVAKLINREDVELKIVTVHQLASFMKKYIDRDFGDNVVLVDEGHKGGERGWREFRDRLAGKGGFVFEYSATFSQAVKSNVSLIREYSRSIIYTYPYHQFHRDGYGKTPVFFPKDKVRSIVEDIVRGKKVEKIELKDKELFELFVENMVRHYAQVRYFLEHENDPEFIKRFAFPLNLFVVHQVQGDGSGVKKIYEWLNRFVSDRERENVLSLIEKVKREIPYLENMDRESVFEGIVKECFYGTDSFDGLKIEAWKLTDEEMGFRLNKGRANSYFAVVYVGRVDDIPVDAEVDRLHGSEVKEKFLKNPDESMLGFLIVARKLIEGFDTVRITSISLVNIGKEEGSLVVQLFGRGVRLRGPEGEPLKREGRHPLMETLHVFGYDADYLRRFIQESELGDVARVNTYTVGIKFVLDKDGIEIFRGKKVPKVEGTFTELVEVDYDEELLVLTKKKLHRYLEESEEGLNILYLVRLVEIYERVIEAISVRNIVLRYGVFERLVKELFSSRVKIKNASVSTFLLKGLVQMAVVDYCKRFYERKRKEWEEENVRLVELTEDNTNLSFEYRISVPAETEVDKWVKEFVERISESFPPENGCFVEVSSIEGKPFAIYVKRHVYYPLMCRLGDYDISIFPDRLEESEVRFLRSFCRFLDSDRGAEFTDRLVVLRNRKTGVGFRGFYPDFILWFKDNKGIEHIIFLDPKGMTSGNVREVLQKARLSVDIKSLESRIGDEKVKLHSFILLNYPLEEYLKDSNIRDSINNFFAENTVGRIGKLSDDEIMELFNIYNVMYLDEDRLIEGILQKVQENDTLEKLHNQVIPYLKGRLFKDEKIKRFYEELQNCEKVEEVRDKYGICREAISKYEVLLLFLTREFMGEEAYREKCSRFMSLKEELFRSLGEAGKEEFVSKVLEELFGILVPFVKPFVSVCIKQAKRRGVSMIRIFFRNKEEV